MILSTVLFIILLIFITFGKTSIRPITLISEISNKLSIPSFFKALPPMPNR